MALAMDGGTPVHDTARRPWPKWPNSTEENWPRFQAEMREVFLSRTEGLPHPKGQRFVKAYSDFLGVKYGVLTTSGTCALELAMCGLTDTDGMGYNGECIVPSYTFIASATAVLKMGFSVRLVDVDYETGNMDPKSLEEAITPRTRVIMPVHILGCPADMDAIMAIARRHNLKVLEDACQSHGALYKGKRCGSIGDAGAFSFQSTKNLNSGEGGFVSTNDEQVWKIAHAIHNVGRPPSGTSLDRPQVGYNYRASEYLASVLFTRLAELQEQFDRRMRAAAYLDDALKDFSGLRPRHVPEFVTGHAYHLYFMQYDPSGFGGRPRSEFIDALKAEGIPCSGGYSEPLQEHTGLQMVKQRHPELISAMPTPNTERICSDSLWFTQNILLADEKDLASIPEAVRKIQKAWHA